MGTYAVCMFGNLHITESKSEVDPELMKLFRATERQVRRADDPNLPAALRDRYSGSYDRGKDDDHDEFRVIYYEVDPYRIRDRLDVFGYTIDAARRLFDQWRSLEIKMQESWDSTILGEEHDADIQRLRDLTADQWMAFIRTIAVNKLWCDSAENHRGSFLGKMLQLDETWYGYGGPDCAPSRAP